VLVLILTCLPKNLVLSKMVDKFLFYGHYVRETLDIVRNLCC
jgi:hypothetical protein